MSKTINRLLSLDPGTETFGVSVFDFSSVGDIELIFCHTNTVKDGLKEDVDRRVNNVLLGNKEQRLLYVEQQMLNYFNQWQPAILAYEFAFMHQQANAYRALVEFGSRVRHAAFSYDRCMPIHEVSPQHAKKSVTVDFTREELKGKDQKEINYLGVKRLIEQGKLKTSIDIDVLDHHSWDSIAVGYTVVQKYLRKWGA